MQDELFEDVRPADGQPVAVLLGGQPGSRKSTAAARVLDDLAPRGSAVIIDVDALRDHHPRYDDEMKVDELRATQLTNPAVRQWASEAIDHAVELGCNIIIDRTMRDLDETAALAQRLRDAGYEVRAEVLAVAHDVSLLSVVSRYVNERHDHGAGRRVSENAHDLAYEGLPRTVQHLEHQGLVDVLTVRTRDGTALYESHPRKSAPTGPTTAAATIEQERARPPTLDELQQIKHTAQGALATLDELTRPQEHARIDQGAKIDPSLRETLQRLEPSAAEVVKSWMTQLAQEGEVLRYGVEVWNFADDPANAGRLPPGMTEHDVKAECDAVDQLLVAEHKAHLAQQPEQAPQQRPYQGPTLSS